MPIKYGDEFSWPVESHNLEAMPVAGRMDGLLGLSQTLTPGSSEVESALYNLADMGLPREHWEEEERTKPNSSYSVFT